MYVKTFEETIINKVFIQMYKIELIQYFNFNSLNYNFRGNVKVIQDNTNNIIAYLIHYIIS